MTGSTDISNGRVLAFREDLKHGVGDALCGQILLSKIVAGQPDVLRGLHQTTLKLS